MIGVSDWMIPYDIQSIHPNVLQTRNLNISEIRNEAIVTNVAIYPNILTML